MNRPIGILAKVLLSAVLTIVLLAILMTLSGLIYGLVYEDNCGGNPDCNGAALMALFVGTVSMPLLFILSYVGINWKFFDKNKPNKPSFVFIGLATSFVVLSLTYIFLG